MKIMKLFFLLTIHLIALEPHYFYSHGLGGNAHNAHYYEKVDNVSWLPGFAGWVLNSPCITFNFPDAVSGFNIRYTSLAQQNEIDTLAHAYLSNKENAQRAVFFGVSRGASVSLSFVAQYSDKFSHPVAIVAESPFDSIYSILNVKLEHEGIHWIPEFITRTAPGIVCRQYNHRGTTPIDLVSLINHNIPVFLICSLPDKIVPARSTANIYLKMRSLGHPHVYLLLLDKGDHVNILWQQDGDIYMYAVHAFYAQYGLPHIEHYAQRGQYYLAQCQPTIEQVEHALKYRKSYILRG